LLPLFPELPEEDLDEDLEAEPDEDDVDRETDRDEELLDDELLDGELPEEDRLLLLTLEPLRGDDLLDLELLDRVARFLTLVPLEDRFRAVDPLDLDDFRTDGALPEDFVRVLRFPE